MKIKGEPFGISLFGLDSMHIRRIEAGILNAGSDFDRFTTPYDVGLERFVDMDKIDFIGKPALAKLKPANRQRGLLCDGGEPHIGAEIMLGKNKIGKVTAGALSPYLQKGIGIGLLESAEHSVGTDVKIRCIDGQLHNGTLATLPLYDKDAEIPRGKLVDIPERY